MVRFTEKRQFRVNQGTLKSSYESRVWKSTFPCSFLHKRVTILLPEHAYPLRPST